MVGMTASDRFNLGSARRAAAAGRLDDWVCDFLASPGSDNAELAGSFAFQDKSWLGPVAIELDCLTPMAGPDDEVAVPVAEEVWEDDVEQMTESLEEGWEPPPVVVSSRDDGLFVEDGNHRVESLRRAGEQEVWAIIAFDTEPERDAAADGYPSISNATG
jgi:hypothetical protein